MAQYRNVSTTFWTDPKVDDDFTPEDKYFYLYLLTNPHTNICGCYEIGNKQIERETGYNHDTIIRLFRRMENVHDVARYNDKTKEVLLLNWGKYNWSKSEKLVSAVKKVAQHIRDEEFKEYISVRISNIENGLQDTDNRLQITDNRLQKTDTDTATDVSIGYGYGIDTEKDTKEKPKKKSTAVNFTQRDNDYADLQRQLLERSMGT